MLELENIYCAYGKVVALRGFSMQLRQGTVACLLGANGAGKSTCLKAISHLISVKSGFIRFNNKDITAFSPHEIVQLGLVQVPEGRMLFPQLTVEENLNLGAYCRKNKAEIKNDRENLFKRFPILSERRKQSAGTLSGGEQQMLAIARSLMAKPEILLLDEPSLGLAPVVVKTVFDFIAELKHLGTTILLVEQNAAMALKVADYGYVLETGNLILSGTSGELRNNQKVRESYLGSER